MNKRYIKNEFTEYSGLKPLMKDGKFILPTNTFIVTNSIKKDPTIEFDELHGNNYIWKLDNGIILSSIPTYNGDLDFISIDCNSQKLIGDLPYI